MSKNPLIKKYGKKKQWVNFKLQTRNGKTTKIPYSPITKKLASSTDPLTWGTYEQALSISPQVGIVFTPDQTLLGIDIDHCLEKGTNKIIHEQKEIIAQLILEADTYTEISPSGEGLHLYLSVPKSFEVTTNKCAPYEVYSTGRYFTVTGKAYGEVRAVRNIRKEEASSLLSIIGYPFNQSNKSRETSANYHTEGDQKSESTVFTTEEVISRMFLSKGGNKIKELYNGNIAEYENDASRADMAFLSHLAFWTRKDFNQMKEIWQASPLGKRPKTQERPDYVNRSLNAAIANCNHVYETPKLKMESQHPDMDFLYKVHTKGEIEYLQNTENICRILRSHKDFAGTIRYDVFKNVYELLEEGMWRTIEDNDAVVLQTRISILFSDWFGKVGKDMVYDAIIKVAKENTIDSAKDYIESLTWDGEQRLDTWLSSTFGVQDTTYHKAVGSNWMKGLVKRIVHPGCKFDYVLVLEGPQGAGKSTSLGILGGDWHVESAMSTESKDFFMQFQGKAIIEFSEGETLSRTEVKRMKAIITMQNDKYRPPYERTSQDFPRRCVFAMTTNQEEYLKDETGNRRWLPVRLVFDKADTVWLKEHRDQLFAEAYHRVITMGESVYEFPEEETKYQQELRSIGDPNESVLVEWYMKTVSDSDQEKGVTVHRAFKEALCGGFSSRAMNKYEEMSISRVFEKSLGLIKRRKMQSGVRMTLWYNPRSIMREEDESEMQKAVRDF